MALLLLRQVVTMFILIAVGYVLYRTKKISGESGKIFGNLLIYVSLPCVIVKSFLIGKTPEMTRGLLISAAAALASLLVSMLISALFFKKDGIASFAGAFSNPGFFGIPLITASLGDGAVVYVAFYIAFLNLLQWSYGTMLLTRKTARRADSGTAGLPGAVAAALSMVKRLVTAPFMIAIIIGLLLYASGITLPSVITQSVGILAGLNTPVAMFAIGVYLAGVKPSVMLRRKSLPMISLVRLVLVPLATLVILFLLPSSCPKELPLAILISSACPVGSNIAVYARLYGADDAYATETVIYSTLLCIVTIPLIAMLAGRVL